MGFFRTNSSEPLESMLSTAENAAVSSEYDDDGGFFDSPSTTAQEALDQELSQIPVTEQPSPQPPMTSAQLSGSSENKADMDSPAADSIPTPETVGAAEDPAPLGSATATGESNISDTIAESNINAEPDRNPTSAMLEASRAEMNPVNTVTAGNDQKVIDDFNTQAVGEIAESEEPGHINEEDASYSQDPISTPLGTPAFDLHLTQRVIRVLDAYRSLDDSQRKRVNILVSNGSPLPDKKEALEGYIVFSVMTAPDEAIKTMEALYQALNTDNRVHRAFALLRQTDAILSNLNHIIAGMTEAEPLDTADRTSFVESLESRIDSLSGDTLSSLESMAKVMSA